MPTLTSQELSAILKKNPAIRISTVQKKKTEVSKKLKTLPLLGRVFVFGKKENTSGPVVPMWPHWAEYFSESKKNSFQKVRKTVDFITKSIYNKIVLYEWLLSG